MNNMLKQISKLFYLTLDKNLLKYVQQLPIKIWFQKNCNSTCLLSLIIKLLKLASLCIIERFRDFKSY